MATQRNNRAFAAVFHNISPLTRESEIVLERIRLRFKLPADQLKLLEGDTPVIIKRHPDEALLKSLTEAFGQLGAVVWVQDVSEDQPFRDRRSDGRRCSNERRASYRRTLAIPERRMGSGRRRDDFGHGGRDSWQGLVV